MIEELSGWKYNLQGEDEEAVTERFADAVEHRDQWLALRAKGNWEESGGLEESPGLWKQMFGFGGRRSPDDS